MPSHARYRRRRRLAVLLLLALMLSCGGGLGVALYTTYQATEYPGATQIADQNIFLYLPNFAWRRTTAYRTGDPFPKVYNWYSSRLSLGPESHAQSNCILMAKSATVGWGIEEQTSVTVCNTPTDRMMFVMRSFYIRYSL
jgi:hypothetical protein